jgi:hypothetical protein
VLYQIPYLHEPDSKACTVACEQGRLSFPSRQLALAFVREEAVKLAVAGVTVAIALQGPDGQWRLFTPELTPAANTVLR